MFRHPKYYAALRAERRKHQATSLKQAASDKHQAKPEPSSGSETSSDKHQLQHNKRQA